MNTPNVKSIRPQLARLWTGILAGPLAWAIDEVIGYTATAHECSIGSVRLLDGLTIAALTTCAVGFFSSYAVWRQIPKSIQSQPGAMERTLSMALAGMFLSVAFAVVIIATAIPKWILSPCD